MRLFALAIMAAMLIAAGLSTMAEVPPHRGDMSIYAIDAGE